MFGKKSKFTELQKFIIAKGREVGNLKAAGAPFNKKQPLSAPLANGGKLDRLSLDGRPRPMSPGKGGPVKLTGD